MRWIRRAIADRDAEGGPVADEAVVRAVREELGEILGLRNELFTERDDARADSERLGVRARRLEEQVASLERSKAELLESVEEERRKRSAEIESMRSDLASERRLRRTVLVVALVLAMVLAGGSLIVGLLR